MKKSYLIKASITSYLDRMNYSEALEWHGFVSSVEGIYLTPGFAKENLSNYCKLLFLYSILNIFYCLKVEPH